MKEVTEELPHKILEAVQADITVLKESEGRIDSRAGAIQSLLARLAARWISKGRSWTSTGAVPKSSGTTITA